MNYIMENFINEKDIIIIEETNNSGLGNLFAGLILWSLKNEYNTLLNENINYSIIEKIKVFQIGYWALDWEILDKIENFEPYIQHNYLTSWNYLPIHKPSIGRGRRQGYYCHYAKTYDYDIDYLNNYNLNLEFINKTLEHKIQKTQKKLIIIDNINFAFDNKKNEIQIKNLGTLKQISEEYNATILLIINKNINDNNIRLKLKKYCNNYIITESDKNNNIVIKSYNKEKIFKITNIGINIYKEENIVNNIDSDILKFIGRQ